jgi:hypothetical protein
LFYGKEPTLDMKYWEIIADNLSKTGWIWGCVSAVETSGRTIWIAGAHRDDSSTIFSRKTPIDIPISH